MMTIFSIWSTFVSCSSAVKEGSCSGEDLQQLQNNCLSYGMQFSGNTGASDLTDCSLGAEQGATSVSVSGDCKIQGEGECTVTCTFPPNDETNTDTNTNPESTDQDNDGFTIENGDCDDNNPNIHPEAAETPANGVDENCDAHELCYLDEDGDGFGSELTALSSDFSCTTPGVSAVDTDCFDLTNGGATIYPGSAELDSATACMQDEDEDGYGNENPPQGVTVGTDCDDGDENLLSASLDGDCDGALSSEDCDDNDSSIYPAAVEIPGDGIDQNCDGMDCYLTVCDFGLDLGNAVGADFVVIPSGTYMRGSPSSELGRNSDEPQHQVELTNDFYMMTTEVTQGMYYQLMGYQAHDGQPTSNADGSFGVGVNYPAYYVSWHMAAQVANTITQSHNDVHNSSLDSCYTCTGNGPETSCSMAINPYTCTGYRLPTEAEWEYAARSGSTSAIWTPNGGAELTNITALSYLLSDGSDLRNYAWYAANNSPFGSKEAAQLLANDYGLYDMSGNIYEWCHDSYDEYDVSLMTDPMATINSELRVFRGGRWSIHPSVLRSAFRGSSNPSSLNATIGFRLSRTIP